ncbi:MAG TPA: phosphotransferase [Caulobacteraceae bacterium]|nr:phosphotransferase [Caulobacteraceae bacterium]
MSDAPQPEVVDRAEALLGWRPERWRRVHGGYTPAARYVGECASERCFLKVATNPVTAGMLRREAATYETIDGDPFAPAFIGWDDHPDAPLLVIEDLSQAIWPPPWTPALIDDVLERIEAVHRCPTDLAPFSEVNARAMGGWSRIAADRRSFLSLGVASPAWLDAALPTLVAAEQACPVDGPNLVHFDIRSDNICIAADGAKLIDWAAACAGDPALDLAGWLPSLELEGGPPPEAILPGHAVQAAWVCGYFAARAGQPLIPDAPRVRDIQKAQLSTALPWVQRALDLPPLDPAR